jgi:hypothetical protein
MERKITFKTVEIESGTIRRNAETGVEFYEAGGWFVEFPTNLSAVMPTWTDRAPEDTFASARAAAIEKVREIRQDVAAAFEEASRL